MYVDLIEDIAEDMASLLGVYDTREEHSETCTCRSCFVTKLSSRIRKAAKNEKWISTVLATSSVLESSSITKDQEDTSDQKIKSCPFCGSVLENFGKQVRDNKVVDGYIHPIYESSGFRCPLNGLVFTADNWNTRIGEEK